MIGGFRPGVGVRRARLEFSRNSVYDEESDSRNVCASNRIEPGNGKDRNDLLSYQ